MPPENPKYHILIVEDSSSQAIALEHMLGEQGLSSTIVTKGTEALQVIEQQTIDGVITDIFMPEMSGYDLCAQIKLHPKHFRIPVLLITALADPQDIIKSMQAGADCFLTKPYNEQFLIKTLKSTIMRGHELKETPLEKRSETITFGGTPYTIDADQGQIISLLLSTYENAVQKNHDLENSNVELKRLQRELKIKAKEDLKQQKSDFLSMAAHDLRNPLSIIYEFTTMILSEYKEKIDENLTDMLSRIHSNCNHMLSLLNNLLDISVIESGQLKLNPVKTNLAHLLTMIAENNDILGKKKGVHVTYSGPDSFPDIEADTEKIQEVVDNLVSNSIKFSCKDQSISLDLSHQEGEALIKIADQGQGMKPEKLEKLFEGGKGEKGTSGEKSTGLGLVIVKKIVDLHGGKIWAESEEGKGTTFYVSLPMQAA